MTPAPRGRRPGAPDTKGEVLAGARAEFAERGYDGATVRGIAARAGVDPALVHHYFGTKEGVFVAAMELPVQPADVAGAIVTGDPEHLAERVVDAFLGVWEHPAARAPFLALLRGAMQHETAAALLRQFISRTLLARVAATLDAPDAELRVELTAAALVGTALLRHVVRLEPLASTSDAHLRALLVPTVRRYLQP